MLSQNACATMTQTLPVFLLVLSFERRSLMTEKVTASSERMRKVWKGITVVIFFVLMSAEVVVGLGAMRDDGLTQSWAQAYVTGCFIVAIAAVSAPVVMRDSWKTTWTADSSTWMRAGSALRWTVQVRA